MNYWVITEASEDNDCSHRWIAYPATTETLEDVKRIGALFDKPIFIAQEIAREG